MKTTELLEIGRALHSIELILDGRYGDNDDFVPWPGPTHLRELPTDAQAAVNRKIEEVNNAARERAAIHICLTSTAVLLDVTQRLMSQQVHRSAKDRAQWLKSLIEEIKTATQSGYHAGLMLAGHDPRSP